ncbi:MAG: TIGR04086 family membrane protein [Oscillospiraceae bacterium]
MRRKKKNPRGLPFAAGTIAGFAVIAAGTIAGALLLSLAGASPLGAGAVALASLAAGSFVSGRTAGAMRRRGGLKTGAVCGLLLLAPLFVISLGFGLGGWVMLMVKAVLCVAFGAAGGVAGVNRET